MKMVGRGVGGGDPDCGLLDVVPPAAAGQLFPGAVVPDEHDFLIAAPPGDAVPAVGKADIPSGSADGLEVRLVGPGYCFEHGASHDDPSWNGAAAAGVAAPCHSH